MTRSKDDGQWHLDKKVPIALIFAIIGQTVAAAWFASALSTRVDQLERQANASSPQAERIVRLEENMKAIQQGITEIKSMIRPNRIQGEQ